MSGQMRTKAPARRMGDEWLWVGFHSAVRSGLAAEHAGLELERLHVDELARLLLQAAEFQLRGALGTRRHSAASADRWGACALEFEAWRSTLLEQLEALHADRASLSPHLARLIGACLAAAAEDGEAAAQALERSASGHDAADSARGGTLLDARERRAHWTFDAASSCGADALAAHSATSAATSTAAPGRSVTSVAARDKSHNTARDAAHDTARDAAAWRRPAAASARWPAARELAHAARVLAPSARSHCALGRAQLAAGDASAARGCFHAALSSTVDARLQREAQLALDELCRASSLSPAVGADAGGVPHTAVPQF